MEAVRVLHRQKMPPEVSHCHPQVSSLSQFFPPPSPKPKLDRYLGHKCCQASKKMKITGKKFVPVLFFILTSISILRLLRITIKTSSPPLPALAPTLLLTCSSSSPTCSKTQSQAPATLTSQHDTSAKAPALTEKEFKFLSNIISHKAPCNLLVFGVDPQYLVLSLFNAGGLTIFLEDNPDKLSTIRPNSNSTRIYKVEYQIPAKQAYKLLKQARQNPDCAPRSGLLQVSTCQLALAKLPQEVYELQWDVVVVDGPSGDSPDAPGRMSAIYTASMIARSGNATHVVVHDVDRMIEKWFSWEFLCEENLVSSKGKLWNFKIAAQSNSTRFCPPETTLPE